MFNCNYLFATLCLLLSFVVRSHLASDWSEDNHEHYHKPVSEKHINEELPKDRILLKDVKTLIFQRNKRTTSKRTHSIHQLSCVGGTAGCKLFTPDVVECENAGYDNSNNKYNWRCHAEISDRVVFNHVEVICEGYDYPEDDYILLGSCGLEFTLDYTNPHDYHHNSYFKHMDDHEKKLHHERVRASTAEPRSAKQTINTLGFFKQVIEIITNHIFLVCTFSMLVFFTFTLVRFFGTNQGTKKSSCGGKKSASKPRPSSYGPLTSAVLTTKKAC